MVVLVVLVVMMTVVAESRQVEVGQIRAEIGRSGSHRWKATTDCSEEEIESNRASMIERGWWRPGQSWLLQSPPPGPSCQYAMVLRKGPELAWYQPDIGKLMGYVADKMDGTTIGSYLMKDSRHWGIYYIKADNKTRMTDICLNVCDVRDDIPFKTYSNRLAQLSGVQPWPMDFCVWDVDTSTLNTSNSILSPLTPTKYDCERMWQAQTQTWSDWPRKTFGPSNQCQHIVKRTLQTYEELGKSN